MTNNEGVRSSGTDPELENSFWVFQNYIITNKLLIIGADLKTRWPKSQLKSKCVFTF